MDFCLLFTVRKKLLIMTHVTPQTSTDTFRKPAERISFECHEPPECYCTSRVFVHNVHHLMCDMTSERTLRDCWFSSCLFKSWYLNSAVTNRNSLFLFSSSIWHNFGLINYYMYWKYYTIIITHSLWTISRKYHVDLARSGSYVPSFKTWGNEARSRSAVPSTVP